MPSTVRPINGVLVDGSLPINQAPAPQTIRLARDTNGDVRARLVNSAGAAVALAGASCALNLKQYPDDPAPLLTKTGAIPPTTNASAPWNLTSLTLSIAGENVPFTDAAAESAAQLAADVAAAMVTAGRADVIATVLPSGAVEFGSTSNTPFAISGTALTTLGLTAGTYAAQPSATGIVDFAFAPTDTETLGDGTYCYDVRTTFPDGTVSQVVPLSTFIIEPSGVA